MRSFARSVFLLLIAGCATAQETGPEACLADVLGAANVVSLDADNRRVFAVYDGDEATRDAAIAERLRRMTICFPESSGWHGSWSASFFADQKYADYKDAESVRAFVISGEWERAYLAEYDHADGQVLFDPVTAPRTVRLTN